MAGVSFHGDMDNHDVVNGQDEIAALNAKFKKRGSMLEILGEQDYPPPLQS